MTKDQQTLAEAAAFRSLVAHLQARSDVQNIELMTLAGFCRNCLSKWYPPPSNKRIRNLTIAPLSSTSTA